MTDQSPQERDASARNVGTVVALWRYPIKSLAGEAQQLLQIDERGVVHDRRWALVRDDGGTASGKSTRRFRKVPELMRHQASLDADSVPRMTLVDGRTARVGTSDIQDLVDEVAGPEWAVQPEREISHFDAGALHLITMATLSAIGHAASAPVEVERLRPNVVLAGEEAAFSEDGWIGSDLWIGDVCLRVAGRTERCVMVNQVQACAPARRDVLKTIGRLNQVNAGIYASVSAPGTVRVGDKAVIRCALR